MKLKDWLKERKKRRAAARMQKQAQERAIAAPELTPLDAPELTPLDADTEGVEQPESRFTDEYREFLKREEVGAKAEISREEL